jgi:hypothetical protein
MGDSPPLAIVTPSSPDGRGYKTTRFYNLFINEESEVENMEIVTADLSKFGHRERELAEELLKAWREQGLPDDFYNDGVNVSFNLHSGYVFLTNEEYQVAMMNGDNLESFYTDFETGEEGFLDELSDEAKNRIQQ